VQYSLYRHDSMESFGNLSYVHPLEGQGEELPAQFTYPFRYTPHPLCRRAALVVQERLRGMGVEEGKMYGVLVGKAKDEPLKENLYFLAAYSGQLRGSYDYPWFVPPVVDYLDPESHFQKEQAEIVGITRRMEAMRESEERRAWQRRVAELRKEKEKAVAVAKQVYENGKRSEPNQRNEAYIRLRQFQKAEIHRAKQLHKEEIADLEARLAEHNAIVHALFEERKRRSEALQQWLFDQFRFLNAKGEEKGLSEIFKEDPSLTGRAGGESFIPSGAGECCAPKLLQTAYQLGLQPLAMAEFWWGDSKPGHYRQPGAFFPACRSKCYPILGHMLQGLDLEPDPALHYDNKVLALVRVIWEDESLAVIDKPEGWCSIPGKSDQPNLLDEAHKLWPGISGSIIVHRLDQDTSGLMVIAKNASVHRALSQMFERREVKKKYVALLEGTILAPQSSVISLPLGPDLDNMPHQHVDFDHGKEAVTHYEVLGCETRRVCRCVTATTQPSSSSEDLPVTRVAFYPQTGRTHQLRVHSASPEGLNTPILGDRLYGHVADRLYLHAESIQFVHPLTKEEMHFCLPAPF